MTMSMPIISLRPTYTFEEDRLAQPFVVVPIPGAANCQPIPRALSCVHLGGMHLPPCAGQPAFIR